MTYQYQEHEEDYYKRIQNDFGLREEDLLDDPYSFHQIKFDKWMKERKQQKELKPGQEEEKQKTEKNIVSELDENIDKDEIKDSKIIQNKKPSAQTQKKQEVKSSLEKKYDSKILNQLDKKYPNAAYEINRNDVALILVRKADKAGVSIHDTNESYPYASEGKVYLPKNSDDGLQIISDILFETNNAIRKDAFKELTEKVKKGKIVPQVYAEEYLKLEAEGIKNVAEIWDSMKEKIRENVDKKVGDKDRIDKIMKDIGTLFFEDLKDKKIEEISETIGEWPAPGLKANSSMTAYKHYVWKGRKIRMDYKDKLNNRTQNE